MDSVQLPTAAATLLLFAFATLTQTLDGNIYYIQPNNNAACPLPSPNCLTLFEIAHNQSSQYISSNTVLIFMPGDHYMPSNTTLSIQGVTGLTIQSNSEVHSRIMCMNNAFKFINVSNLHLKNIAFSFCGREVGHQMNNANASLFLASATNVTLDGVTVQHGEGYGVYATNILKTFAISSSVFFNNTNGGNVYVEYGDLDQSNHEKFSLLSEAHSFFMSNSQLLQADNKCDSATGISFNLNQRTYKVDIFLQGVDASHNKGSRGSSFIFTVNSLNSNLISVNNCTSSYGVAADGGSGFHYTETVFSFGSAALAKRTAIEISNSHFFDNQGPYKTLGFVLSLDQSTPCRISIKDTAVYNNIGSIGAALYMFIFQEGPSKDVEDEVTVLLQNVSFFNNTSHTPSHPQQRSIIYVANFKNFTLEKNTFSNNTGTAILADNSQVFFRGNSCFTGNLGYSGGAIALYGDSLIHLSPSTFLDFVANEADNAGGAIYVANSVRTIYQSLCFFQIYNVLEYLISGGVPSLPMGVTFLDNYARIAGNDVYGGSLEKCVVSYHGNSLEGWRRFEQLFTSRSGFPDVSSDPSRVCLCNETDQPNCTMVYRYLSVRPGEPFNVSVVAVGQWFNAPIPAGVPTAIYSKLLLQNRQGLTQGRLKDWQLAQEGSRICSNISYTVQSANNNEVILLTVGISRDQHPIDPKFINKAIHWFKDLGVPLDTFVNLPVYVNVTLLPCPLGFELSPELLECICANTLREYGMTCDISDLTVLRRFPFWIGVSERDRFAEKEMVYIVHKHCPFDYCKSENINIDLMDPDAQCAFNHSGTLCGGCKQGLSVVLGSSKCRRCSNIHLTLLLAFIAAGIGLIVFLIILNVTVSEGTINGLIFYVNIVKENQDALFPHGTINILTVFISWLNLDLGIETCFYDGMDAYGKAWLQFVFPIYIWSLTGIIVVASRYYTCMGRLCGRNIVQVLATLFLLSYTKLQRAITTTISFTILNYANQTQVVWLYDGNLAFVKGKHIPLFLAGTVTLLALFLPYTLVVLFGPCLQSQSGLRVLFLVRRMKPFFDAYLGPYKDKYRYWTGLLLVVRVLLLLFSALNVLGDPNINLLTVAIVANCLMVLLWLTGGVYKKWPLNLLECSFFLNLSVLATTTLYNHVSGGNQAVLIHLSTGAAFVTFVGVIAYHSYRDLSCKLCSRKGCIKFYHRTLNYSRINPTISSGENENTMYGFSGVERSPQTQSVIALNELREPVLDFDPITP